MNTKLKNCSSMEHWCRSIVGWNRHFVCDATNHMCDTLPMCRAWDEKSVFFSYHWTQHSNKNVVLKQVREALRQKKKLCVILHLIHVILHEFEEDECEQVFVTRVMNCNTLT